MQEVVALLLPAAIAVGCYSHLSGGKVTNTKLLSTYATFVVTLNLIVYAITIYVFQNNNVVFTGVGFFKFIVAATVFAFPVAFAYKLIETTVEARIDSKTK